MNLQRFTDLARAGYEFLIASASNLKSPFLLVVRLYWGWQMVVAGSAHLSDVPAMVERFQEWGVPLPTFNVYVSGVTECVCGLLLLAGLRLPLDHHTTDHQFLRRLPHRRPRGPAGHLQRS